VGGALGLVTSFVARFHLLGILLKSGSNQLSKNKKIIGFLSVIDAGILVAVLCINFQFGLVYYLGYRLLLLVVVYYLRGGLRSRFRVIGFSLGVLRIRGFPPFLGFFFKLKIISILLRSKMNIEYLDLGGLSVMLIVFPLLVQFIGYLVLFLGKISRVNLVSRERGGKV